ncbi:flavin reductase family protein [Raineyella sp. LH-20]|uniref:flavin reductase family protein n=1 Tax=Raineyella sp. LH-20 TaxID=3081204 RepID=UPI002953FAA1|nr:flavin reductase family protein [Raineyella sp. LH-20]WOP19291.1 flavin reductase family protein [Raineyella sp. LH-20]
MTETAVTIDDRLFRDVMGHYPTGVVIVTGTHPDGERLAMVVGTFSSVSLQPALVSFLPMKTSRTFQRLRECPSMCLNVLTGRQEHVGRAIAGRRADKFAGLEWHPSPSGDPILAGSLAWIDVRLKDTIEAGDHWIALCEVVDLAVHSPEAPLIFFQGGYGRFTVPSLLARIDEEIIGAVHQAERARDLLESIAVRHHCEASLLTVVNEDELVVLASAVAPGIDLADGLGVRVPIVPPIADVWVAEQPAEVQERWLAKAVTSEGMVDVFRDRLAWAAERGYLMSFLPAGRLNPYAEVSRATRRYAAGDLTPAEERDIRRSIASSEVSYRMVEIDPAGTYDVGMVVATVHDPAGRAVRMLRLGQFPRQASGAEVERRIAAVTAGAAELEGLLFDAEAAGAA